MWNSYDYRDMLQSMGVGIENVEDPDKGRVGDKQKVEMEEGKGTG